MSRLSLGLAALFLLFPTPTLAKRRVASLSEAMALMDQHQWASARPLLEEWVAQNPADEFAEFNLAGVYFNLHEYERAGRTFLHVAERNGSLAWTARLCVAKCYRKLERFNTAWRELDALARLARDADAQAQVRAERENLRDAAMASGVRAYDERRYETALAAFDVAAQAAPRDDVHLMRGLTLVRLARFTEAQPAFRVVVASSANPELRDHARYFIEQLESRVGGGAVWLFADLAAGYNTNVFLDGTTTTPTTAPTSQVTVGTGVQIPGAQPWFARLGYNFYYEEAFGFSTARYFTHTLRAQLGYEDSDWFLKASPSLGYQTLGGTPFLLKAAVLGQIQRSWTSADLGVQVEGGNTYGQGSPYSYLTGNALAAKAYVDYVGSLLDIGVFYVYANENDGDFTTSAVLIPQNNWGHGPGAKAVWYPSSRWQAEATFSLLHRTYRTLVLPGSFQRLDNLFSTYVKVTYQAAPSLRLFASVNVLYNVSTLSDPTIDDKNYSQIISVTGISWDILN